MIISWKNITSSSSPTAKTKKYIHCQTQITYLSKIQSVICPAHAWRRFHFLESRNHLDNEKDSFSIYSSRGSIQHLNQGTGAERHGWSTNKVVPEITFGPNIVICLLPLCIAWSPVKGPLFCTKGGIKSNHPPRKRPRESPASVGGDKNVGW